MAKRETTVSDFMIAPRKPRPENQIEAPRASIGEPVYSEINTGTQPSNLGEKISDTLTDESASPEPKAGKLISPDKTVQRERSTSRALRQEASRLRLQDLKQNKARESKHFVNCPLDFDTKQRLARASAENQIKMTVIIKAAIDQYLRDNGY